jgi:DNA-binding HxlR family transcriptional regulator
MSSNDEPAWVTERVRQMEADGIFVKHPPGWQPPPVRVEDLMYEEGSDETA